MLCPLYSCETRVDLPRTRAGFAFGLGCDGSYTVTPREGSGQAKMSDMAKKQTAPREFTWAEHRRATNRRPAMSMDEAVAHVLEKWRDTLERLSR